MARLPAGAFGALGHRSPDEPIVARLDGLEAWLDYAVNLGCSGLLLGPIFDSVSHGYDTLDHYSIDPRLGDDAASDRLIEACRARDVGHAGRGLQPCRRHHHLVAEGLTRGAWEGHGSLATLAHDDARVADLVTDIMLHWLRRGIAGWRLDVAYSVPGWFWSDVIGRVRQEFGDAVFLGEVIHGDYPAMVAESRFDSVTQYELWKAIWSSIQSVNFWELAHALERHQTFTASFVPNTFIGNHDVSRIASVLGDSGAAARPCCSSPCRACRASTTATSRASAARRARAGTPTRRCVRRCRPRRRGWPGWAGVCTGTTKS